MTATAGDTADLLGLSGMFPRPGWVVLDAVRDRRFTGEVVLSITPEARVYVDRGRIYLAERVTDPSLGARLVDAGALNAAQLERGAIKIGGGEHLGRLFERVPSIDRHAVIVTAELMTEECVAWIAGQTVYDAVAAPYRHHPSGAHRWDLPFVDLLPGDPLPAPAPDAARVDLGVPEPLFTPLDAIDADEMITWNEPGFLDERGSSLDQVPVTEELPVTEAAAVAVNDWIDHLERNGLPEEGDPLVSPVRLPDLGRTELGDRFEMIWPSGEVDDDFGSEHDEDAAQADPEHDRVGPTARLVPNGLHKPYVEAPPALQDEPDMWSQREPDAVGREAPAGRIVEATQPDTIVAPVVTEPEPVVTAGPVAAEPVTEPDTDVVEATDEVVMAVRRAVASIETGSLAARRRLVEQPGGDPQPGQRTGPQPVLPGRLAARSEAGMPSGGLAVRVMRPVSGSVFDDVPIMVAKRAIDVPLDSAEPRLPSAAAGDDPDDDNHRTSALRRLIGSLRRR